MTLALILVCLPAIDFLLVRLMPNKLRAHLRKVEEDLNSTRRSFDSDEKRHPSQTAIDFALRLDPRMADEKLKPTVSHTVEALKGSEKGFRTKWFS
jgi:hypothetical protein